MLLNPRTHTHRKFYKFCLFLESSTHFKFPLKFSLLDVTWPTVRFYANHAITYYKLALELSAAITVELSAAVTVELNAA